MSSKLGNGVIDIQPIVSTEQRDFIRGTLDVDRYLQMGQLQAERQAKEKFAERRIRSIRIAAELFGVAVSIAYIFTALIFYIGEHRSAAVTAALLGVGFLVSTTLLFTWWRHLSKTEGRR
jgi:hypothetical protein